MARDWKIGEVVWLKSGGPAMTVTEATKADGSTSCRWYAPEQTGDRLHYPTASFHKDCLTDTDPQIQSIRKALNSSEAVLIPHRPESIKVEPVTINWQGPIPSAETVEQLISRLRATSQDLLEDSLAALYDHKSRADFALDELLKLSRRAVPMSREKIATLRELWWPAADVARPTERFVELKTEAKEQQGKPIVEKLIDAATKGDQPKEQQKPVDQGKRSKPLT